MPGTMVSIVSRLKKQKNGDHFGSHLLIANHDGRVSFRPWDTFTIAVSGFQRVRESSREKERKRENRGRKGTMRRPFQRAYIVGLTLAGRSGFSFADDLKMNVRSRELPVDEISSESPPCRCEYPGEGVYDVKDVDKDDYVTIGKHVVLPSTHMACLDVWFLCPGVEFPGASQWQYECPSATSKRGDSRALQEVSKEHGHLRHNDHRTGNVDETSHIMKARVNRNPFPQEFHHLVGQVGYYTMLPEDSDYCVNGGTRIHSGEKPNVDCTLRILSFKKAGDRRPLPGGTTVANEWYANMGVKITASSDSGPGNMHPTIFDMENPTKNGVNLFKAAQLGKHDEFGNVLVAVRPEGSASDSDNDSGMLHFEFFQQTHVNFITLLNVNEFCRVIVTQANGKETIFTMDSAGRGGIRIVEIDLKDVFRMTVSFQSFAAIVSMDLCLNRLADL